jgi:hypothetical protein
VWEGGRILEEVLGRAIFVFIVKTNIVEKYGVGRI